MSKNHSQSSKKNHLKPPRNLTQMTWTHTSLWNLGKIHAMLKVFLATTFLQQQT